MKNENKKKIARLVALRKEAAALYRKQYMLREAASNRLERLDHALELIDESITNLREIGNCVAEAEKVFEMAKKV